MCIKLGHGNIKNSNDIIFSPDGSGNPRRDCNEQREKGWQENTNDSLKKSSNRITI